MLASKNHESTLRRSIDMTHAYELPLDLDDFTQINQLTAQMHVINRAGVVIGVDDRDNGRLQHGRGSELWQKPERDHRIGGAAAAPGGP